MKFLSDFRVALFYLRALASLFASLKNASVMNGIATSKQVAIKAAIKPYSIAVAPRSFLKKASIRSLLSIRARNFRQALIIGIRVSLRH